MQQQSPSLLAIADGLGTPRSVPARVLRERPDLTALVGWMPVAPPWIGALTNALTIMGGYALKDALHAGSAKYLPLRYGSLPRVLRSHLRPCVAVVSGRPSPQGYRFGLEVAWGFEAAAAADEVIVEVDASLPVVDSPLIPGNIVRVSHAEVPLRLPPAVTPSEVDLAIGQLVAGLVPRAATIQCGAGAVPDAALHSLERPVRVMSGVVTDALVGLAERGLLEEAAVTDYLFGGAALLALARSGRVRLGVRPGNSLAGPPDQFVSINSALQVGLDGAVNAERVDGVQIAGIGGHADYCAWATIAQGGLSIIALPSLRRGRSTIVARVEVVSTPRSDVDIVITEHGIADLRGRTDDERATALQAIAHPSVRAQLARDANAQALNAD